MNTTESILLLQKISAPYASGFAHVQGPGGNASVKFDGKMAIKASGFTFSDVAQGTGYAMVNLEDVFSKGVITNKKANEIVVDCHPSGSRPSMEFQFHAMLDRFVLHTHSVYAGVVLCAENSSELLNDTFNQNDFLLLPYVTPGLPIAEQLLAEMKKKPLPPVLFLKNHGMIIHHNIADEVLRLYNHVENLLAKKLSLDASNYKMMTTETANSVELLISEADFQFLTDNQLTDSVLIPDQSIFFKDKTGYSKNEGKAMVIDLQKRTVNISGSPRFIAAGAEMLHAVLFIRRQIKSLGLTPQFLKPEDIADIHGLESEKHRISALN